MTHYLMILLYVLVLGGCCTSGDLLRGDCPGQVDHRYAPSF